MYEAVEVVHGHLHRRSVSSNTVSRRFQAALNPLAECNVFYLQVKHIMSSNNIEMFSLIKTTLKRHTVQLVKIIANTSMSHA